jgi:hypothetical protein
MERQRSFAQAEYAQKKKNIRRERFLNDTEAVVPWAKLVACIEPFYFKGERGRKPAGLEVSALQSTYIRVGSRARTNDLLITNRLAPNTVLAWSRSGILALPLH